MATAVLSTVIKAFRVVDVFRDVDEISISDCARLLDMPRPSAHRLLVTLESTGMVERTNSGRYQLGMLMFEIGALAPRRRRLRDASCQVIERLADLYGWPGHLDVLDGTEVLCLVRAQGSARDRTRTRAGSRLPAHATSAGKVLLAHADAPVAQHVLDGMLERVTPHTIVHHTMLRRQLAAVHADGHAWEQEEAHLGWASMAVPVRGPDGGVVAALSVTGPVHEIVRQRTALGPVLTGAADLVMSQLRRESRRLAGASPMATA